MYKLLLLLSLSISDTLFSQSTDSMAAMAGEYFKEAKAISEFDNGRLWGQRLYGPMIFVNRKTKEAIANEQDSANTFNRMGDVFVGKVPASFPVSNTALFWGGKVWTVVMWPLPKDKFNRAELMMHESFHRLQKILGLPDFNTNAPHLDKFEGRLLLKLELEALRKVISAYPNFSKNDLQNALFLRQYRYQKFPGADSTEHTLELNEGLATFTGFVLSRRNLEQSKKAINSEIDNFYTNQTFVRSLGYITGSIYGFLLTEKNKQWNKPISRNKFLKAEITHEKLRDKASFDKLLAKHYHLNNKYNVAAYNLIVKSGLYNYASIYAFEKLREEKRLAIFTENKRKFVDGPVLELRSVQMRFNFDPNEVQVLDGYGPVYPNFSAKADWGNLEVTSAGALFKDWAYVYVSLPGNFDPSQKLIKGIGWTLELKDGWKLVEGGRKGDFKVIKD